MDIHITIPDQNYVVDIVNIIVSNTLDAKIQLIIVDSVQTHLYASQGQNFKNT